jgi:integrase
MAVLAGMHKITSKGDFVFVSRDGRRPLGHAALDDLLRRLMGIGRDVASVHGFRACFRIWCAECMASVPREVAEQCLAHTTAGAVEQAYQRSDHFERRRHLMTAWAEWCSRPAKSGGGEVVAIGRGASGPA